MDLAVVLTSIPVRDRLLETVVVLQDGAVPQAPTALLATRTHSVPAPLPIYLQMEHAVARTSTNAKVRVLAIAVALLGTAA